MNKRASFLRHLIIFSFMFIADRTAKRPSHIGYISTLLKRSDTNYYQTQSIVKGLQDVQTE